MRAPFLLDAIRDRPWGMRDFTITEPTGVLWRMAQNTR
jgi:hypothetical protein